MTKQQTIHCVWIEANAGLIYGYEDSNSKPNYRCLSNMNLPTNAYTVNDFKYLCRAGYSMYSIQYCYD